MLDERHDLCAQRIFLTADALRIATRLTCLSLCFNPHLMELSENAPHKKSSFRFAITRARNAYRLKLLQL